MTDRHVRRSGDDYAQALISLLPQGQAWPRDPDSTLVRALTGLALYWGNVDGRAADLLETESDPRATIELLPDWERAWGLPDPCIQGNQTVQQRRIALVAKMTLLGGQSRQYFYNLADALGYEIKIGEFSPYMCGISNVGDTRGVFHPEDEDHYRWTLGPPSNRYAWTVHVAGMSIFYFRCGVGQCGVDPLSSFAIATDLECLFQRYKPAHTTIVFDYSEFMKLDFTETFNSQYLPLGII